MTSVVAGPYTVDDGTPEQIQAVQRVAAAIPPALWANDVGLFHLYFGAHPRRAPAWAWGFKVGATRLWVNPNLAGQPPIRHSLFDQWAYVIAHEFGHAWWSRHGNPQLAASIKKLMGTTLPWDGGYYTGSHSNRPEECFCDSFARALGFGRGMITTLYRPKVPPSQYGQLLSLMGAGGGATAPPPFPPPSPPPSQEDLPMDHQAYRRGAHLRASPDLAAPVIQTLDAGGQIQTGRTVIGSDAEVDGRRSSSWLEVLAVAGKSIEPPLWVSELVIEPVTPTPAPAARAPSRRPATKRRVPARSSGRSR